MALTTTKRAASRTIAILFCLTIVPSIPGDATCYFLSNDDAHGLSLERLFEGPPLDGVRLREICWNGDGTRVGFLRPADEDGDILDLWAFDMDEGRSRLLVRASDVLPTVNMSQSDETRERSGPGRTTERGITGYAWSPDGRSLLFTIGGSLSVFDLETGETTLLDNGTEGPVLDPKFSPDGSSISYVRHGDLWILPLEEGEPKQLTERTSETVTYGLAEFVARTEMGRHDGYWWSSSGRWIAYLEVDVSDVEVRQRAAYRFEGNFPMEQRYPAAGTPNAKVRVGILDTYSGKTKWVEFDPEVEYVARVDWGPKDLILAIQVQPRDQRWLRLVRADPRKGKKVVVLEERSLAPVNLHDDIRFLSDLRFVWSSEKTGTRQLSLYDARGDLVRRLTDLEGPVVELEGVDERGGRIFFSALTRNSRELNLFSVSLRGGDPVQITGLPGWHDVEASDDCRHFVDTFSSALSPPEVTIHDAVGTRIAVIENNPTPEFDRLELSEPEFFRITAADGRTQLNATWTKPPDFDPSRRYPVVIRACRGPQSRDAVNRWRCTSLWEQFLARQGYVVFGVDPRGSNSHAETLSDEIRGRPGVTDVADYTAAVEYLKTIPFVDRERIGIMGWGYGGSLAVLSLLETEGLYSCGIAVSPITDWHWYDSYFTERYLGLPEENNGAYAAASPLEHDPGSLTEELLLVHGMADERIALRHSLAFAEKLQQAGVKFDMMLYPGKARLVPGMASGLHLSRMMFDFFEAHLKPEESRR